MANRSLAGGGRARARLASAVVARVHLYAVALLLSLAVALLLSLALTSCKRNEPAPAPPPQAPASSAHPEPFVHPPIPSEPPATPQARPECSYAALVPVAARIREAQKLGTRALEPTKSKRKKKTDGLPRCGTPALTELEHQVKGELADRVRMCVGQDGPLDPEWNLLEASLASLGSCIDCTRMSEGREVDCQRTAARVTQAETDAAKHSH